MDVMRGEIVEVELGRLIERRSARETDPDELEPSYMESVRVYTARRREEMRAARVEWHQAQAARLRAVLEELATGHEQQAAKLMEAEPKGAA